MNCPIKCPIDVVSLNRHYKNHKVLFYSFIILSGFINRFGKDFTVKILKLILRKNMKCPRFEPEANGSEIRYIEMVPTFRLI